MFDSLVTMATLYCDEHTKQLVEKRHSKIMMREKRSMEQGRNSKSNILLKMGAKITI